MRRLATLAACALLLSGCGADPAATPEVGLEVAPQLVTEGNELHEKTCPTTAARSFEPRTVTVEGVTDAAGVVYPPRTTASVPGTPPVDEAGKQRFAFDRDQDVEPGDRRGNVLLNAHTFPDGSALGNRLLDGLRQDGLIEVSAGDQRLCYRVTERVEVDATQPFDRYYEDDGPPQLAIVVCSGERLGPGVWTKRTVWFASPAA